VNKPEAIVFVVDDDASFRLSLERLLRMAEHKVESFASALEFLNSSHPDVAACLLTDLRMPGLDGLGLQRELAASGWQMPIIFITGQGDIPSSVRAMKAGAIEFLTKPVQKRELLNAVSEALQRDRARRERAKRLYELRLRYRSLTRREREVMTHVISGMLNKQIAAELGTTEKTIKFHRGRLTAKMGARSVAELVRIAVHLEIDY
jgi:FixJ family two-component response regulator